MTDQDLSKNNVWKQLTHHVEIINQSKNHLKYLLADSERINNFSLKGGGIFYDFSRQRIDKNGLELLFELAESLSIMDKFKEMMAGEKVNVTENRAALHTAARSFSNKPLWVDEKDVMPEIRAVREKIKTFSQKVYANELTGATGKPFQHIVVIGIGGSYLGTEFVTNALNFFANKDVHIHFLSNVDIHNFGEIISKIVPETTLWVIISKSYTTAETKANTEQAYRFMQEKGLPPEKHVVTVTSKGSPGDDPSSPVLDSFNMFDFIGGRYSVTSAVGGVPLSLYMGYENFEAFLKGAEEMDLHAKNTPIDKNLPLISALLSIWNNNFLGYPAQAIIPYATPLCKLPPHIQQLYMESNGKSVKNNGDYIHESTGVIIFGEPGTNAQHSFFQLAHQGRKFPIDFIGIIKPLYKGNQNSSQVSNHQELWANLVSQPTALALGRENSDTAKSFEGNRPSSTILLEELSPVNIGRLLSFYEAKTILEAFIWDINPFDQFGVELGKHLASNLRKELAIKNKDDAHKFTNLDSISEFYMDLLFSEKL